ncbi:D-glycero-beta-D-manno-heptose 1,7-bisphosphate 7-phosphatase [Oceanicoccus sp. KOV_DT_Chl]|uniref:D-glycero-beta-D-manno-heptose 1,7-bisphosphate 7-phosphatase n=1 Tax=Oceanicoccus sp. KOV_DT_Chl TaxID=1904639 RepID=UPI001F18E00A|nr:D-glycero-beta-D-manno-heptose 1,7-bisphosphate 7-phosphatase [Oceanicoccus sp. KOV_DT_Chl]
MKLVILDRDGVINKDSDAFVKNADEWIPIDGSIKAIARLCKAGFTVVVATNQSGIGRGLFDLDALNAMHKKMHTLVEKAGGKITGVFYCPHGPDDGCACRKPKAGLINAIEQDLNTSANGAIVIGDSLRDLQAG